MTVDRSGKTSHEFMTTHATHAVCDGCLIPLISFESSTTPETGMAASPSIKESG